MTIQDWIGVLWLIAITILYVYAYHIRREHTKHKEQKRAQHKENSRQIVQDFIKEEKHKKEQQEQALPAHIRIQNAIDKAHQRQAAATQHQTQDLTEINEPT